jgi:hypothetical protein
MYRIPGVLSAATKTPAPAAPRVPPTPDLPPGSPQAPEAEVVVRRLLTAGEDLQAALGLLGDHPASAKIRHAVDEMDQAIRDIRGPR